MSIEFIFLRLRPLLYNKFYDYKTCNYTLKLNLLFFSNIIDGIFVCKLSFNIYQICKLEHYVYRCEDM